MVNLTLLSLRTAVISLSHFFSFFESHENIIENNFILLFEQMGMQKIYSPILCSRSLPQNNDFCCWETRKYEQELI